MKTLLDRRDFLAATATAAIGGLAYNFMDASRAAAQAPAKRLPINIVNTSGNPNLSLQELIKRLGYLDEFGVDATTTNVADSSKIIGGLIGGSMDICMLAGFGQAFPAMEKGAKLKVVAGANTLAPVSLFSGKPDIKTPKDLEGKIIGTGAIGAALHQIAVALLQKKGVDVNKVKFVSIGNTADILKGVIAGTVDAGTVNVDVYGEMGKHKIHPIADFFTDLPEYPYQGSFVSDNAIKNKREAIVRTLAAYGKLYRFISTPNSKDAYIAAYVAATGGNASAGESQWQFIQKYKPYAENLVIPDKNISYIQELNVQTGVQKSVLPAKDVADMSLAQDALKLL